MRASRIDDPTRFAILIPEMPEGSGFGERRTSFLLPDRQFPTRRKDIWRQSIVPANRRLIFGLCKRVRDVWYGRFPVCRIEMFRTTRQSRRNRGSFVSSVALRPTERRGEQNDPVTCGVALALQPFEHRFLLF